ncbi:MAG: hypothetical protein RLZZ214_2073 [Verrucomicrobiota bacterium]
MADREGFEPSVTLLLHTLSKRAHSTTLTPALGGRDARNSIGTWQPLFEIFENQPPRSCVLHPGEDPEEVGKAVEKQSHDFRHGFAGFVQNKHGALGTAGDGARIIEAGAGQRAFGAGPGPAGEADAALLVVVGGGGDPFQILRAEVGVFFLQILLFVFRQRRELAHQADETRLDAVDDGDDVRLSFRRAGEAEGGVELIDGAEGFDAEGGFRDAFGKHQICFPLIAAA